MRVRFEQVDGKEKEQALIRAVEKTADIMNAMDLFNVHPVPERDQRGHSAFCRE